MPLKIQFLLLDFFAPWVLASLGVIFSWTVMRGVHRGAPLEKTQRTLLFYLFWFLVGALYSVFLVFRLHLPKPLWLLLTIIWSVTLAAHAQKRDRKISGRLPHDGEHKTSS
jgi:hypothetical protein